MKSCENYMELISGGADSELQGEEKALLFEHIETCRECRALYDFYVSLDERISGLEEEPPERLLPGIMTLVKAERKSKKAGIFNRLAFRSFTAMAAAACVIVLIVSHNGGLSDKKAGLTGGAEVPESGPEFSAYGTEAAPPALRFSAPEPGAAQSTELEDSAFSNESVAADSGESADGESADIMATAAPADNDGGIKTAPSQAAEHFRPFEHENGRTNTDIVTVILSEHPGEFSKALIFYGASPMGVEGGEPVSVNKAVLYYVLPAEDFLDIETTNASNQINFQVVEDDLNLDKAASNFIIVVCE